MPIIKKLSDSVINLIAAGEVVEKPSSVIKELVENSIDAGASEINVFLDRAGKNKIIIIDNGCGMTKEDMQLAIQRHTTSKLDENDIMNIKSFGFRGEALPSIASISRMKIVSRAAGADYAYALMKMDDSTIEIKEENILLGTKIEINDLFFSTPARLKFLKSDSTELSSCFDVLKKLAISYPEISFSVTSNEKLAFKYHATSLESRISQILPKDFIENAAAVDLTRDMVNIRGYVSIPTYNRATSGEQYLFVNNRPVKDKLLIASLKVAYKDFLESGRHPVVVIFMDIDPQFVDVNVHPAKIEVRFQDANLVRNLLISAIKDALYRESRKTSTTISANALGFFQKQTPVADSSFREEESQNFEFLIPKRQSSLLVAMNEEQNYSISDFRPFRENITLQEFPRYNEKEESIKLDSEVKDPEDLRVQSNLNHHLGFAIAQFFDTYILSQTNEALIIIDQHAAHERLVYEQIKVKIAQNGLLRQRLLIPEIVEFNDSKFIEKIIEHKDDLEILGLKVSLIGNNGIKVEEVPSILGEFDISPVIKDIADYLIEFDSNFAISNLIEHVTETYACHHSIRAGRKMNIKEMNELIHQMEETPFSGQCNHGRPTYIKIDKKDIEKLFGRR